MTSNRLSPAKRKTSRRTPAAAVVPVLTNEVAHLALALAAHVAETASFRREVRDEFAGLRDETRREINALHARNKLVDEQLAKYKGALGLLALLGSAVAGVAMLVVPYFKH